MVKYKNKGMSYHFSVARRPAMGNKLQSIISYDNTQNIGISTRTMMQYHFSVARRPAMGNTLIAIFDYKNNQYNMSIVKNIEYPVLNLKTHHRVR